MDHDRAVKTQAAERYLLGEMGPAERDEFEGHYFECADCARDVQEGDSLISGFKAGLPVRTEEKRSWVWTRPFAWAPAMAAAALCVVVVYQNAVTIPGLRSTAEPQAVSTTVLRVVRGSGQTVAIPGGDNFFNLVIDVNAPAQSRSLECDIEGAGGGRVTRLTAPVKDGSVSLLLPAARFPDGDYVLNLRPEPSLGGAPQAQVESHPFHVERQR